MINEFKIGYYYKFIGDKDKYIWNDDKELISDNKWHKCIDIVVAGKNNIVQIAQFESMEYSWFWNKKNFIESKYPPKEKVKKLLKEIK